MLVGPLRVEHDPQLCFEELRKNDFVVTQTIADKIINIPAGTAVDDATDSSKHYVIKPLEVSEFLTVVVDPRNAGFGDDHGSSGRLVNCAQLR